MNGFTLNTVEPTLLGEMCPLVQKYNSGVGIKEITNHFLNDSDWIHRRVSWGVLDTWLVIA